MEIDLFTIPGSSSAFRAGDLHHSRAIAVFAGGIWYYNKPSLSDFLIETEAELENKVTWLTRDGPHATCWCDRGHYFGLTMMADGLLRTVQGVVYG